MFKLKLEHVIDGHILLKWTTVQQRELFTTVLNKQNHGNRLRANDRSYK